MPQVKTPVLAKDFRFAKGGEALVASNGELNASSRKDALYQSQRLMAATAAGEVMTEQQAAEEQKQQAQRAEALQAAFTDPAIHRELGETMAQEIYMTGQRSGFMRRFLNRIELRQGDIPRFEVEKKDVTAFWAAGPTKIETEILTSKWMTPPELSIIARPFVPQNEINQSNTDVLGRKYLATLEAIMVTEDRLWANLARATIGVDNQKTIIAGTMTPTSLMSVRQQVAQWGLKVPYLLMASDLFVDMVSNDFSNAIEPVVRHELVMTGQLGTLYGMTLISEAYRHPEHKVLNKGEMFAVADPITHGAFSDRGGINASPIDTLNEKVHGRGWIIDESVALSIANSRSVAVATRV